MDLPIPDSVKFGLNFVHPLVMWLLFGLSLYAMYLGIQIRRLRTAEGEAKTALAKQRFNEKHHLVGSLILVVMVLGTIGGMAVTYLNNGKLFVGPHLLVGLGMTSLVATTAALTPWLQKKQGWARNVHIALNIVLVGLFGWQAVTGMQIVQRILSQ